MSSVRRLLDFIEFKGIKKSEFYQKTGLSNGYLDKVKDLGAEKIEIILTAYPEINVEWLVAGKVPMLRNIESNMEDNIVCDSKSAYLTPSGKINIGIPLVSWEAVAGFGNARFSISKEDVQENYLVPDFKEIDFMIRLRGSSMYPKYSAGDVVACRIIKESQFIQWNKTYIVATAEQGIICKRLKKSIVAENYLAVSDNKDYEPFDLPIKEITGIALIVGVIRLE